MQRKNPIYVNVVGYNTFKMSEQIEHALVNAPVLTKKIINRVRSVSVLRKPVCVRAR